MNVWHLVLCNEILRPLSRWRSRTGVSPAGSCLVGTIADVETEQG